MKSKINPHYLRMKFQFVPHRENNVLPIEVQSVNP